MQQDLAGIQLLDLTDEIARSGGVSFDSDEISLKAVYADQVSAYRARRVWMDTLEESFLLEAGHDFDTKITSSLAEQRYSLSCNFLSACGRYAFWRLTNNQAPEAQYFIETAHIPDGEHFQKFLPFAEDLHSRALDPLLFQEIEANNFATKSWLKKLVDRIIGDRQ